MIYKQFPGIRGELQGGVLDGFDLFFGLLSINFPDDFSIKKSKPRAVRPLQLAKYTVFHEESKSEVKNAKFQAPGRKK